MQGKNQPDWNLQSSRVHLAVPIEDVSNDEAINSWCVKNEIHGESTDKGTSNVKENKNEPTIFHFSLMPVPCKPHMQTDWHGSLDLEYDQALPTKALWRKNLHIILLNRDANTKYDNKHFDMRGELKYTHFSALEIVFRSVFTYFFSKAMATPAVESYVTATLVKLVDLWRSIRPLTPTF